MPRTPTLADVPEPETATPPPDLGPYPVDITGSPIEWSTHVTDLFVALIAALGEMPPIAKDNTANMGSFVSKYTNLGSMLETIRPILAKHRLAVIQPVVDSPDGTPIVTTMVIHASGQWLRSTFSIKSANRDAHAIGSAITYARRYALGATLGLASIDDDDGKAAVAGARQQDAPAPPPPHPDLLALNEKIGKVAGPEDGGINDRVFRGLQRTLAKIVGADTATLAGTDRWPSVVAAADAMLAAYNRELAALGAQGGPGDDERITAAKMVYDAAVARAEQGDDGDPVPDDDALGDPVRSALDQAWAESESNGEALERADVLARAAAIFVEASGGGVTPDEALAMVTLEQDRQDAEDLAADLAADDK